jgi:hypothetical protein
MTRIIFAPLEIFLTLWQAPELESVNGFPFGCDGQSI